MARERWIAWRNRILSSPRFQDWATRFPLTRPVARRRARALFDLVAGFTYSQTLHACVELGLFDMLATPRTIGEVAAATRLPEEGALRLLRAAAALDLVEPVGDRWTLGAAGAELSANTGALAMIAHHPALYADLADPVALLRKPGGGALARYWAYARGGDAAAVANYSALMAASQAPVAAQILDAYDFGRHRRVLDIGGGEGAFLAAVRTRHPALALGLFDLPAVAARARARLGGGVTLHSGDFLGDSLPGGYDLITLVRVLHDHDDAPAMTLLRSIRAALPPGGRLLIGEPMAGASPVGDTYFGWYLAAMGSGRARRADEIAAMLRESGFDQISPRATALPLIASVLIAA